MGGDDVGCVRFRGRAKENRSPKVGKEAKAGEDGDKAQGGSWSKEKLAHLKQKRTEVRDLHGIRGRLVLVT